MIVMSVVTESIGGLIAFYVIFVSAESDAIICKCFEIET